MNKQVTRLILAALLAAMLSACAAAVIGGAAAGGYQVSQNRRTADMAASDARITAAINSLYVRDERISAMDIHVATYKGIVTLQGRVVSQASARRAIDLARSVKGVNQVVSKLTVAAG